MEDLASGFHKTCSTEKRTVRAKPCQSENIDIHFAVDQQQVGLDMAFTVAFPIAIQLMVALFGS